MGGLGWVVGQLGLNSRYDNLNPNPTINSSQTNSIQPGLQFSELGLGLGWIRLIIFSINFFKIIVTF